MLSVQTLEVVEVVARCGSFTAAASSLHKVPSAISYTIRQLEQELQVQLFERRHRSVALTPAGEFFVGEARNLLKQFDSLRRETQRVANGWRRSFRIAVDNVVNQAPLTDLVAAFNQANPHTEMLIQVEVFNGVWDALADGRADLAIGATDSIPVGAGFSTRPMGSVTWDFVLNPEHELAHEEGPLANDLLRPYPSICLEDTSRNLPKRYTWLLDNQRRLSVPNWDTAIDCFRKGLGVGFLPHHIARPLIEAGELVSKPLIEPKRPSYCCLAWGSENDNPALAWSLDFLGPTERLEKIWLS